MILPVLAGAALAGFIQGLTGFAYGLVAMSVWIWFLEPRTVAALVVIGALSGQLTSKIATRSRPMQRRLFPYLAGAGVGVLLGLAILPAIDVAYFQLVVGAFLLIWCPIMLSWHRMPTVSSANPGADAVVGILAGAMAAIGGLSGPLPVLWTSLQRLDKEVQRSIIQDFNFTILSVTFIGYVLSGHIRLEMFITMVYLVPISLMATIIGLAMFRLASQNLFRNIILSILTVSGAILVIFNR